MHTAFGVIDILGGGLDVRKLNTEEVEYLQGIYGNSIDYSEIRIQTGGAKEYLFDMRANVIGNDIFWCSIDRHIEMKRRFIGTVLIILMPLLSGCPQNLKSRNCPAFNHPLAKQWQPVESGSTVVFTRVDGESAVYLLQSMETPVCESTSTHVFVAEDDSHEIIMYFTQRDNDGFNLAQEFLALTIEVALPAAQTGEPSKLLGRMLAANLVTLPTAVTGIVNDELEPQFFASQQLENGQMYSDVIEFPSSSIPPESEFEQYLVSEIKLSRNVGLIQISREIGGAYSVVSE